MDESGLNTVLFIAAVLTLGHPQITHAAQDLVPTVMPPSWRLALEQTVPSSNLPDAEPYFNQDEDRRRVYLVQGSKGVGKSTFSKALLNRLLSKWVYFSHIQCMHGTKSNVRVAPLTHVDQAQPSGLFGVRHRTVRVHSTRNGCPPHFENPSDRCVDRLSP